MQPVIRYLFARVEPSMLLIGEQPARVFMDHRQRGARDSEAGGVMLGRLLLDSPHVIIDEVTAPLAGDRRSRFAFDRARRSHQEYVSRRWFESGGTCLYLGEWHTHPEPIPQPSATDERDWRRRLAKDTFDVDTLFFVIVGTSVLKAWEGHRDGRLVALADPEELST